MADSSVNGYYVVTSIRGSYTANKTLLVTQQGSTYSVSFDDVPANVSLYVRADVYPANTNSSSYMHIWTGRSAEFSVSEATTAVSLTMKDMTANTSDWLYNYNHMNSSNIEAGGTVQAFELLLYANGKYQIKQSDADALVVSEGTWSCSTVENSLPKFADGSVVSLTECAYRACTRTSSSLSFSDNQTIVTYPAEASSSLAGETSGSMVLVNFTFVSGNGLSYQFSGHSYNG